MRKSITDLTPLTKTEQYTVRNTTSNTLAALACSLAVLCATPTQAKAQSLVDEARSYIGTNPTGRGSLWCGAFMDFILKKTGHRGGGNLALGYAHYGRRTTASVGAIAVMGRRGGGHVGVVSGFDAHGNPIIISGNTWRGHNERHTVAEGVYPRSRIFAYVEPEY
jgi:uncharacterized protein (TIGR02594 family)